MATAGEMGNLTRGDGKKSLLERLFGGGGGKAQRKEEEEEANCAKLATLQEEEEVEEKEEERRRQGHEECAVGPSCSREEQHQQAQGWPKDSYRRAQQEGPLQMDTVCVGGGGEGEGGEEERIRVRGIGRKTMRESNTIIGN
jgi:hypothetical protein